MEWMWNLFAQFKKTFSKTNPGSMLVQFVWAVWEVSVEPWCRPSDGTETICKGGSQSAPKLLCDVKPKRSDSSTNAPHYCADCTGWHHQTVQSMIHQSVWMIPPLGSLVKNQSQEMKWARTKRRRQDIILSLTKLIKPQGCIHRLSPCPAAGRQILCYVLSSCPSPGRSSTGWTRPATKTHKRRKTC